MNIPYVLFQVYFILVVKTDACNLKVFKTMGSFEGPGARGLKTGLGDNHADI